jgi:hypothetical protein
MLDLARLKDNIAVRQDHRRAQAAQSLQHLQRLRIEAFGERVIHEEGGHRQQLDVAWMFDAEALKRPDIVAIAQLRHQTLKDRPIALAGSETIGLLKMVLQILLDSIIVDQRVVYVDEEDDRMRQCHAAYILSR